MSNKAKIERIKASKYITEMTREEMIRLGYITAKK